MSKPASGNRSIAVLALCLAIVGAAAMLYYHLHLFIPNVLQTRTAKGLGNGYAFGADFYPIWLVARQWQVEHRDPYNAQMTRQIQTGLFGRVLDGRNPSDPPAEYREFAYPAFTEVLLGPTAAIEFPTLRLVLAVLLPLLTVASLWLWMLALQWRIDPLWFAVLVVLSLCNYPVLEAFFAEQPGLIAGFLLASSLLALRHNHLSLAGGLLSLTLIKPQMTLLAALYLMLWSVADRRRVRFLAGFLLTTLLMVSASLWIWPHWIGAWIRVLLGYHRYATPPLATLLLGSTLGLYVGPIAIVGMLGVGIFVAWRNRQASVDSPDFWLTLSLPLAITSVTLLPGQAVYDHVILIPGIFLVLRYRRVLRDGGRIPRALLVMGAIVLCWQWVAALGVIAVHPWLSPEGFTAVLTLPIRSAASLPFAVLALLFCATKINLAASREVS
jgi:hypothetical protein